MFGPLGFPELMFILILALLIFGPRRLPEIGRTVGRAMGELRKATSDLKGSFDTDLMEMDEPRRKHGSRLPASRAPGQARPREAEGSSEKAVSKEASPGADDGTRGEDGAGSESGSGSGSDASS